jgi:hypothetical protein
MSETRMWDVLSDDSMIIAAQSGTPVNVLYLAGIDTSRTIGQVEAATKGEAIMKAHSRWPRIPVKDLDVRPAAPGETGAA